MRKRFSITTKEQAKLDSRARRQARREQDQKIVQLYANLTGAAIAERLGLTVAVVEHALRRQKVRKTA